MKINPLSAILQIYPSSKRSSQWPHDGYVCHGWMTSSGRGRDSATRKCFGRGSQGTIFVRSSKLSLFFPELCPFRRVPFISRAFERFGAKRSSSESFGFDDVLEVFLRTPLRHHVFFWSPTTTTSIFWKLSSFVPKQIYFSDRYGHRQPDQSILLMVRPKLEWKLDFRALARSN